MAIGAKVCRMTILCLSYKLGLFGPISEIDFNRVYILQWAMISTIFFFVKKNYPSAIIQPQVDIKKNFKIVPLLDLTMKQSLYCPRRKLFQNWDLHL